MSLNKKHFELLSYLEKCNSLSELSIFLNSSERNIRYQIEELNFELKNEFQIIVNKQNVNWKGMYVDYDKVFKDINQIYYSFSTSERITLFILYSLVQKEKINISQYSKKLEVSKPTLKNDMKFLQEQLKKNKIFLLQDNDMEYYFKYNDLDFCFFIASFLNKYILFSDNKFVPRKKTFFYTYFFKSLNPNKLFEIDNLKLNKIRLNISISDEAFNLFVLFSCILKYYQPNIKYKSNVNFFKCSSEYEIIDIIFNELKADYKLWLCDFLIGVSYNLKNPLSIFKNWLNIEMEIYKVILEFSNLKNIHLVEDRMLYEELLNHIKPLLYRTLKNISLGNSILGEVKHNYGDSFEICRNIFLNFEKNLNVKISDDEIAFVVLIFERAIKRENKNKSIKSIAVVCNYGISASSFLKMRLKEIFRINCIDAYSLQEYQNLKKNNFDLIVTTIDLENKNDEIPIVKVSPVLNKTDISILQQFTFDNSLINTNEFIFELKKICNDLQIAELKELINNKYSSFFDEINLKENNEFIELSLFNEVEELKTIEEGIKLCTRPLLDKKYIKDTYIDSLIKSLQTSKTNNIYIGENTIFPHCINNNNVNKTKFSFLKLKKPIIFKNRECKLIVCFCTNEKNTYHNFLFKLFEILGDSVSERKLYSLSIKEYFNYLNSL